MSLDGFVYHCEHLGAESVIPQDPSPLEPYERPLALFPGKGRVDLYRARPGEAPDGTCALDPIASCIDLDSAIAAARLLTGEAAYPLWKERQPWSSKR